MLSIELCKFHCDIFVHCRNKIDEKIQKILKERINLKSSYIRKRESGRERFLNIYMLLNG